jgi:hypothetical protein
MEIIGYIAVWLLIAGLLGFSVLNLLARHMGAPEDVTGNKGLVSLILAIVLILLVV